MTRRVAFLGSKPLGQSVLEAMARVVPPSAWACAAILDDRDDDRSAFGAMTAWAAEAGLPARVVTGAADAEAALRESGAEVVVVSGWYRLLPVDRFHPGTRFYGLHAALLPAYRGNAPLVWQMINGEPRAGVTFFEMVDGIDEGDVVGQASFAIEDQDSIAEVLLKAAEASVSLVDAHLPALLDGTAAPRAQDHAAASYCGLRIPADGRIDWSWPSERIRDFVRAQTRPYPGAFTHLATGERLAVWRVEREAHRYFAAPGSVAERRPDHLVVGTGDGALRLYDADVETDAGTVPALSHVRSLRTRFV